MKAVSELSLRVKELEGENSSLKDRILELEEDLDSAKEDADRWHDAYQDSQSLRHEFRLDKEAEIECLRSKLDYILSKLHRNRHDDGWFLLDTFDLSVIHSSPNAKG